MPAELPSSTLWEMSFGSLRMMWHSVSHPNFLEKRNLCRVGIQENCKGRLKAILLSCETL